jgi:hypothetical protein
MGKSSINRIVSIAMFTLGGFRMASELSKLYLKAR